MSLPQAEEAAELAPSDYDIAGAGVPSPVAVPVLLRELQQQAQQAPTPEKVASAETSDSPASAAGSLRERRAEQLRPLRTELRQVARRGTVEERILAQLIDDEFDVMMLLEEAKRQLAHQSLELIVQGNPQSALLLGQVLHRAVSTSNVLKQRIQNCAAGLANLRLQQHLLVMAGEARNDGD